MSGADPALIRAAFEELHQEFAGKLPLRVEALAAAIRAASATRDAIAPREEARALAHQLRGSAGSYGFPSISAKAAQIEDLLADLNSSTAEDRGSSWGTIVAAVAALEDAARAA